MYCDEPGPTRPLVNIPSLTGNTGQNAPSLSCSFGRSIRPPYWDSPLFPSSLSIHHTGRAGIISPIQTSVTRSYFEIIQLHSITTTQLNHSFHQTHFSTQLYIARNFLTNYCSLSVHNVNLYFEKLNVIIVFGKRPNCVLMLLRKKNRTLKV